MTHADRVARLLVLLAFAPACAPRPPAASGASVPARAATAPGDLVAPRPTEEAVVPEAGLGEEIASRIRAALPPTGALFVHLQLLGSDRALHAVSSSVEQSLAAEPRVVFAVMTNGASVPERTGDGSHSEAVMASEEPSPTPRLTVQLTRSAGSLEAVAIEELGPGVVWTPFRLTTR